MHASWGWEGTEDSLDNTINCDSYCEQGSDWIYSIYKNFYFSGSRLHSQ